MDKIRSCSSTRLWVRESVGLPNCSLIWKGNGANSAGHRIGGFLGFETDCNRLLPSATLSAVSLTSETVCNRLQQPPHSQDASQTAKTW
jgi:hypothetical protein